MTRKIILSDLLKFTGFTHYTVQRVYLKFQFFSLKGCGDTKPGTFSPSRHILSVSASVKIDRPVKFNSLQQEMVNFVRLGLDKIDRAVNWTILTNAETDKIDWVLISTKLH